MPSSTEPLELAELSRQLIIRTDFRVERIRQGSNDAIAPLSKVVQGQLRQTLERMAKLGARVQQGSERVRLQVVATGHTADTRHTDQSKAQSVTAAQIVSCSMMVERMLHTDSLSSAAGRSGGRSGRHWLRRDRRQVRPPRSTPRSPGRAPAWQSPASRVRTASSRSSSPHPTPSELRARHRGERSWRGSPARTATWRPRLRRNATSCATC